MRVEHLRQGLGEMAQELKAIGDLGGRGGPVTRPVCLGGRAIACDHLDPRMVLEPLRQRGALAVWEERAGLAAFQVHEDGAIRVAFLQRLIIHAQDAGRREVRLRLAVPQAQERVPADPQVPRAAQASPSGPAQRHAERAQGAATVGRRSVKRRRRQWRLRQNHWRTRSWRRTRYAAQGRAARVRSSWL